MRRAWRFALVLGCALLATAQSVGAQQARAALTRDSVNVGDIVGVAVEVLVPAGTELITADTLQVSGDIENAAHRRIRIDTLVAGGLRYLITYPIAAWRPGTFPLPKLSATLQTGAQQQTIEVTPPQLTVASVLPADTANVQPKPLRDVWGANRLWWPLILLALLLLAIIAALIWWWRKRKKNVKPEPIAIVPQITPREWVIREIDRIVAARYIEKADFRGFYIDFTNVMRSYVSKLDSEWGPDLTTLELAGRIGSLGGDVAPLFVMLNRADLVKFARHRPIGSEAHRDIEELKEWVNTYERPIPRLAAA